ncbi:MAG: glycosyltransferase [Flavobacteriaceae bacterium TMED121]|nr:MAG: glycosyltransferase [Flavobacteriaceae bacterium TMED121]
MQKKTLAIIIPCYNEANRLPIENYKSFFNKTHDVSIFFINDGSIDETGNLIQEICIEFSEQVNLISLEKNKGKGNAVLEGFHFVLNNHDFKKIAFLDADLSTSLEECCRLANYVEGKISLVFGSRILKLDNNIKRKWYRFFFGRIVATAISKSLKLSLYDSQCGCKIFDTPLAKKIFGDPFLSKWLFDVEIFFRAIKIYGRENIKEHINEVPLNEWVDTPDSRVSPWYFFRLWWDLHKISNKYKN